TAARPDPSCARKISWRRARTSGTHPAGANSSTIVAPTSVFTSECMFVRSPSGPPRLGFGEARIDDVERSKHLAVGDGKGRGQLDGAPHRQLEAQPASEGVVHDRFGNFDGGSHG